MAPLAQVLALLFLWVVWKTWPASLFLIGSLVVLSGSIKYSQLKEFRRFLGAVSLGFAFVWAVALWCWIYEPHIDADDIKWTEALIVGAHTYIKRVASPGWRVIVATLAALGLVSYYLPSLRLVSRFVQARKVASLVLTSLTVVSAFALVGDPFVLEPRAREAVQHYSVIFRKVKVDETRATSRAIALNAAAKTLKQLSPPQIDHFRAFLTLATEQVRDEQFRNEILRIKTPKPRLEIESESESTPLLSEVQRGKAAAMAAEQKEAEADAALREIVSETISAPAGVALDIAWKFVRSAALKDVEGLELLVAPLLEKGVDVFADKASQALELKTGLITKIMHRLVPAVSVSADIRFRREKARAVANEVQAIDSASEKIRRYVDGEVKAAAEGRAGYVRDYRDGARQAREEMDSRFQHLVSLGVFDSSGKLSLAGRDLLKGFKPRGGAVDLAADLSETLSAAWSKSFRSFEIEPSPTVVEELVRRDIEAHPTEEKPK
jgi:hypothetical protein